MSAAARDIVFTRHPGSRGLGWLKESYAMFRTARLAWILLLMTYYLMLLFADFIPFIGGLAAPCAIPTLLALSWAPALVVFQAARAITALAASLRAALANWRPILRYVVSVFFFGGFLPTLAGTLIALVVPAPVGRALALALM